MGEHTRNTETASDVKLCECGCGRPAPIAKSSHKRRGYVKGEPVRFISGHNVNGTRGKACRNYKKGKYKTTRGYIKVLSASQSEEKYSYISRNRLVAEKAIGKRLPANAVVHHFDGKKDNDAGGNLVICQDQAYHLLLHQRQNAIAECGNPNWIKCHHCGRYDDPGNMYIRKNKNRGYHQKCQNAYQRKRYNAAISKHRKKEEI